MYKEEASVRDEWPTLTGYIGTAFALRKFANIVQVADRKKGAAALAAVSKLRTRL